jgi:hypothetical protein
MKKAIALFGQQNPDIAVSVEFAPFAEFYDRLPVQYSGGGAPDIRRRETFRDLQRKPPETRFAQDKFRHQQSVPREPECSAGSLVPTSPLACAG